ncbi:hypothetical protein [Micromonospora sp. WMMD736]|uniref:hypothetical protein n=1 Tax=Micromonospora sp. WMMD736 TaxID=3404112 RepID=UPI003B959D78
MAGARRLVFLESGVSPSPGHPDITEGELIKSPDRKGDQGHALLPESGNNKSQEIG